MPRGGRTEQGPQCFKCGKFGHIAVRCPGGTGNEGGRDKGSTGREAAGTKVGAGVECSDRRGLLEVDAEIVESHKQGTGESEVGEAGSYGRDNRVEMPVVEGVIGGQRIKVLRDTGCSGVVVKKRFVEEGQFTGERKVVARIDNTLVEVPVAQIQVRTPFFSGTVRAMCFEDALYDLIVGNITGARAPGDPDVGWDCEAAGVETRAQARKKGTSPLKVPGDEGIDITPEILGKLQEEDSTLDRVRNERGEKRTRSGRSWFVTEGGVLYRKFESAAFNNGKEVRQVVVPKVLRQQVLVLVHDCITSGHLGVKRTMDRVLSNFFWPGLGGDVERYCRSCDVCQRTVQKGKVQRVPLENLPTIDTPFKRVGVDIVGPIFPASERGYRYILTVVDHDSRYPEAVPLKNIQAETVAEALLDIYSRVGLPEEVLSDLGTQFVSEVMGEVCRLLRVRQMTTTPYHPMCNGLVERFNGTMKQMLKRLCNEQPKEWDRFLNALLFAYREVPQESTGFSPFELLYGRTVRGPMQILRELWTGGGEQGETKNSYQYVVDLRERLERTLEIAQESVGRAQRRHKRRYDRRAKVRRLEEGDEVLVLLPTNHNKLLMQWKGPFRVVEVVGLNDYRIQVKGRVRTYHINLLKQYTRRGEEVNEGHSEGQRKRGDEEATKGDGGGKREEKGEAEKRREDKEITAKKRGR